MRTLIPAAAAAVGLALALVTPPAAADSCYDDECRTKREKDWNKPRFEGAFGILAGGVPISTIQGSGVGMHVDGGVRANRWALLGEYDFLSVGQSSYQYDNPIRGVMHRIGANGRYSIAAFGGHDVPIRGDFWLEGGIGSELVVWNGGGQLSRRDLAFGAGGQMTVRIGKEKASYLGFYYAFRGTVARDPFDKNNTPPTCAGPCDMATSPSPYDVAAMFNFGVVFSR